MTPATRVALSPGTVLAKDFVLDRRLGEGGMGVVYLARRRSTGHACALKVMHPQLAADATLRARFEREATAAARVQSPHVVTLLGAGVDPDHGTPWIAMEFLEGEDLGARLLRGALPLTEALEVVRQTGQALAAAHAAGVVHRDLKPENIFLARPPAGSPGAPRVKVLDFGVALLRESAGRATQAVGSPLWMAPEQSAVGDRITPATDIWALGLVAFTALTGRSFWWSGSRPQSSVESFLREALESMVIAQPSAGRVAAAPPTLVWQASAPEARVFGAAPPVAPSPAPRAPSRRRGALVALSALALIGGGIAAAHALRRDRREAPPPAPAQPAPAQPTPAAPLEDPPAPPGTRPPTAMRALDLPTRAPPAEPAPAPDPLRRRPRLPVAAPSMVDGGSARPAPPATDAAAGSSDEPLESPRPRDAERARALELLRRALGQVTDEEEKQRILRRIEALSAE